MNKKNLNYVIAKYGITFFFGVHNVNNAIFTYCHVIRNVIMTEKTTIKNKTVLQYDYQTLKSASEEHKFLSIDFPNYLPIYQNCLKKKILNF